MSIRVICTQCQAELEVSDAAAGKKGRCPTCQAVMDIPRQSNSQPTDCHTIVVTCQECHAELEIAASFAGKKGRCPQCQAVMPIPGTATSPGSPPARPEPELVAKPSGPQTATRYVPYEEERPTPKPVQPLVEKPAAKLAPLKTVDEVALLQLPPSEPPQTIIETGPSSAASLLVEIPPPAAKPPPPKIERQKSVETPGSVGAPARTPKPLPPQLVTPPHQQPAAPTKNARTRLAAALESELESLATPAAAAQKEAPTASAPPAATPASEKPAAKSKAPPPVLVSPPVAPASTMAATTSVSTSPAPSTAPPPAAAPAKPTAPALSKPAASTATIAKPQMPSPSPSPSQPKPASREQLAAQILGGFQGPIQRTPPTFTYKLGILLTTVVMVVIPLIYISLIVFVATIVFWHLSSNYGLVTAVRGRGAAVAFMFYISPALFGFTLILFMVKPLFAPSGDNEKTRTLTKDSEPLLFAFVERVCQAVAAPVPRQIEVCCDVNAGARLESIAGDGLALQIGMPLVAGLSLQQFAGVLAHEFGHFSQGAGMRLTYITRRIDFWLIRVVYERDRWDEWLETAANSVHVAIGWILHVLRGLIWGTRWILRLLLYVGHAVTGFMLREMEFDADRFEARLVGGQTFEATVRQLIYLNFAYRGAMADLENFFRDGRLADNLPRLILHNITQLPEEARKAADEIIEESETGIFDSHPADRDRIAAARAENAGGVFHSRLPATVLFSDFDALAKAVTWDLYTENFGSEFKPTAVRPIEEMLERQSREEQVYEAMKRFLLDSFQALRPMRLPEWHLRQPANPAEVQQRLLWARNQMQAQIAAYYQAYDWFDKADTHVIQMRQLAPLLRCNANIMADKFDTHPPTAQAAGYERDRAYADMNHLDSQLAPLETASGLRLHAALTLLYDPAFAVRLADARELIDHCQRLMPLVGRINNHLSQIIELRNNQAILAALAGHLEVNDNNQGLFQEVFEQLQRTQRQLRDLWTIFQQEAYPFDHHEGFMSISHFLLKEVPQENELGGTLDGIDQLMGNLASIYGRSLARLCYIAERVEASLGWQPLPMPQRPQPA